jgi:drug/metabolite transporter (DMT)-like permease
MDYLLLILSIFILFSQTISYKEFNRSFMKNLASYFLFNFSYFSLIVLVLLVFNREFEALSLLTIVLGILFGPLFILTMLFYMKAMENGPLAYSSLLFSFGIVVPVIVGIFFWHEPALPIQIIGLILLLLTLVISNQQKSPTQATFSLRWLLFALGSMLGNGGLMTILKAHQMVMPGREVEEFIILAFGFAAILSFLIFFYRFRRKKEPVVHMHSRRLAIIILAAGLATAFGNLITVSLSARLPAIILFPTLNGGIVILATLFAVIVYRERLTRYSAAGLILGLTALVMISIR